MLKRQVKDAVAGCRRRKIEVLGGFLLSDLLGVKAAGVLDARDDEWWDVGAGHGEDRQLTGTGSRDGFLTAAGPVMPPRSSADEEFGGGVGVGFRSVERASVDGQESTAGNDAVPLRAGASEELVRPETVVMHVPGRVLYFVKERRLVDGTGALVDPTHQGGDESYDEEDDSGDEDEQDRAESGRRGGGAVRDRMRRRRRLRLGTRRRRKTFYHAVWADPADINEIIISATMGPDHMPNLLGVVLNKALAAGGNSDLVSAVESFLAGAVAGAVEATITYPTEYLKTRLQLQKKRAGASLPVKAGGAAAVDALSPWQIVTSTVKSRGIGGLYTGVSALVVGTASKAAVRFLVFDEIKKLVADPKTGKPTFPGMIFAAISAGVIEAVLVVTPTETIKTKLIEDSIRAQATGTAPRYNGLVRGTTAIVKESGLKGVYQGVVSVMMRQGANSAVRLTVYATMKDWFLGRKPEPLPGAKPASLPWYTTFGIGALAGFITVYATMPLDVVKTKMQGIDAQSHYKGTVDCFMKEASKSGCRPFRMRTFLRRIYTAALVVCLWIPSCLEFDRDPTPRTLASAAAEEASAEYCTPCSDWNSNSDRRSAFESLADPNPAGDDAQMSAHAKKVEIAATSNALTDVDFATHINKPGLKGGSLDSQLLCFRLPIMNGVPVKLVRGANSPLVEKGIKEQLELEKNNQPHPVMDLTAPGVESLSLAMRASSQKGTPEQVEAKHSSHGQSKPEEFYDEDTIDGETPVERTLALIKPDAMRPSVIDEVLSTIHRHRVRVVAMKKVWLSKEQATELYREHAEKEWFDRLINYITRHVSPVLAMELAKVNIIALWREVVGPKDPRQAKMDAPRSLRAAYGIDSLINSFHASDGTVSAPRELAIFFGEGSSGITEIPFNPESHDAFAARSASLQKTLAIIKPDAIEVAEDIIARIILRGLKVQKREEIIMPIENAQELYAAWADDEDLYHNLVNFITSGPVVCLVLKGEDVIYAWQELMGPDDPEEAKEKFPLSLHALYGTDRIRNAVHGSESIENAIREIQYIFPHYLYSGASMVSLFESRPGTNRNSTLTMSGTASMAASRAVSRYASKADMAASATVTPSTERTLALIKPDAYPDKKEAILEKIRNDGFTIVHEAEVQFSLETAQKFYQEHEGKAFYETLTTWMSSAPIYAMVLEKVDAIIGWRKLAGPTNSEKAREESPESIRALYGTDGSQNAVHGSDSPASAEREIKVVFEDAVSAVAPAAASISAQAPTAQQAEERTLALIKPDAYPAHKDAILEKIKADGFTIVHEAEVEMTKEKAQEFYKEHEGKGFYEDLTTWMSSAPIYALVLQKASGITGWRALAGPTNSEKAREESPESIRALFGTDGSKNAVHGSDSPASAAREIGVMFGDAISPTAPAPSQSARDGEAHNVTERTLALIKPDAYPQQKDAILEKILADGFTVVQESEISMTKEMAEEFYQEHKGKEFYDTLTTWMSGAPIYAMVLEKASAISGWRALAGPTNSEKAKETAPETIRALYGTDGSKNAVHGSDSPESAAREIGVIFGDTVPAMAPAPPAAHHSKHRESRRESRQSRHHTPSHPEERTLALIKPDIYPAKKDDVIEKIKADGFSIIHEAEVVFTKEKAEEFYKEHLGKEFYETLTTWMSSAPIYAIVLQRTSAVSGWRALAGPTNSEKARETHPDSIRALYGTDGSQNAVHGSDSLASAAREIAVVFGSAVSPNAPRLERTLALIKPDAHPDHTTEIMDRIRAEKFRVIRESAVTLSKEKAEEFYKEHAEKAFYKELTEWMSSAPIYGIVLEKVDGIKAWRALAGPTNSDKARETAPESIRALFGTDGTHNAVHGSDSIISAAREIRVLFGGDDRPVDHGQRSVRIHASTPKTETVQRTLALIKPDAYPGKKDSIMERILAAGLKVVREMEVTFTKAKAEEFYKEHLGKPFYEDLTTWMSSSPIYAIELEGDEAISGWRSLAGPTNSEKARESAPESIRALYGTDGSKNAVHGSDSAPSAEREINIVFGDSNTALGESTPAEAAAADTTMSAPENTARTANAEAVPETSGTEPGTEEAGIAETAHAEASEVPAPGTEAVEASAETNEDAERAAAPEATEAMAGVAETGEKVPEAAEAANEAAAVHPATQDATDRPTAQDAADALTPRPPSTAPGGGGTPKRGASKRASAAGTPPPGAQPNSKPATRPSSKPATRPASKPASKPATRPSSKPASKPASKPVSKAPSVRDL
ncbi:hypothetical protein HK101_002845 [Irineochytrium annulatum]|nr:hypothetical protein HK101_002845 [Irineochytrium annulatum]